MHAPHVAPAPPPARPAAPPRPAAARPGPKPDDGGGLRVLTYLRLHWLMIVFCGTLLGGAGALAAWELLASKYESYAMLQVSAVPDTVANPNNPSQARTDFVTYVKTKSALLKSEFVLNAALRDIHDLPTIKAQKDPIKFLEEELAVVWPDGSEVVRVVFKGHEPADAKRIVDAVVGAFMKEVVEREVKLKQDLLRKIEAGQLKMRKDIDQMDKEKPAPKAAAAPAGGVPPKDGPPAPLPALAPVGGAAAAPPPGAPDAAAPPDWDTVVRRNPQVLDDLVKGLLYQAEQLPFNISATRRQLSVLEKRLDALKATPVSPLTLDAVNKDGEVIAQMRVTESARLEWQKKAGASKTPDTAPGVVALRREWEAHKARLEQLREEKGKLIESVERTAEARGIAREMNGLLLTLRQQEEQLAGVQSRLAKAQRQLAELPLPTDKGVSQAGGRGGPGYEADASLLRSADSIYQQLIQRNYLTQLELGSPERVKVIQQASNPVQRDTKKQVMGTALAGLMGFGLMALGAVGFETVARRVSSLADAKASAPACPVVGVIPLPPGGAGADPAGRAANEAVDKLRAYVSQAWLSRGATTVAVTSPLGDEGKAFAAFGLASSLAQSGYKTLLVDFDLRDPRVHDLAGVPNGAGVCELLRGEADPRSAVQALPSGLHLLPAGKWSDEARRAATGGRLEALLAKLKGPYDCVVMHGHALLTAAESVEVARRCEVVLVCARYRETTTPLLRKAAERVAAMEIPYSGVVYVGATETEALC